ncbi:putative TIM9-translocase of the mitochondrial inner membrane [Paraphysoderma sedebokerense]|nr:putative TIM9-translocase of the mitochondrial inner membrane [Paraphysoderma sedebokerense]
MDFSHLSNAERNRMAQIIEQKQMKDFLKLYGSLVDRCFNDCINDFTSKALSSREDTCTTRCVEKFLKHSERVGQRFAEQNLLLQQSQMQEAAQQQQQSQ